MKHGRQNTNATAKAICGLVRLRALLKTSVGAIALMSVHSAAAAVTVQNGDALNLNGATLSTDTLNLIDGSVVNGTLNASTAFSVRNGTISAVLAGTGQLTKTTSGVVTLSSANTFSGTSNLFAGTLQLFSSASLGTGRIRTTFGVLNLSTGINVLNEIELRNAGLAINVDSGTATWGGRITQETGVFGFEKTGAGNLRITSDSNTFAGPVRVSAGELTIAGTGVFQSDTELVNGAFLTFVKTEGYTYNGVISGTGRVSATNGPLTLTAAHTLTNGTFTINPSAGLILQSTATLGGGTNNVELRGGPSPLAPAVLDLGGTSQLIARLDVTGVNNFVQNGTLNVSDEIAILEGAISANLEGAAGLTKDSTNHFVYLSGANSYTGPTAIEGGTVVAQGGSAIGDASDVTIALGGTLQLDFSEAIGALAGAGAVDLQDNVLTTGRDGVNSTFDGLLAGTGALVKTGTGGLTLTGVNTFEGGTTLEGGTLRVEDSLALGNGLIVTSGASVLDYADGINLANPITLDTNFTQLQVLTGTATHSGVIDQDAGARPLEKTGAGTLTFTAANTYSGETTITAGTLRLAGAGKLFEGANVTVQSGATFDLTDTTQTLTALTLNGNAIATGEVFGDLPNAFLNVDTVLATTASGETAALDVAFASSGTITKNGVGTLRIGGFPNFGFSGTVEHNAGTLQLIWGDALGSGVVNMNGEVVLSLNNGTGNGQNFNNTINLAAAGAQIDVAENISVQHGEIFGAFGFEKTGNGALGFGSAMTYTGVTTISGGSINLMDGTPGNYGSIAGDIVMNGGGLSLSRTDDALNLTGDISGNGQITTNFTFGSATLSGNNTFTPGIFLFGGKIRAGSSTAFGTGPVGGLAGTTIDLNGFDITTGGLSGGGLVDLTGKTLTLNMPSFNTTAFSGTVTAGHIVKTGDGWLELGGGNDLSALLSMTVNGGTLALSGNQNIAGAPVTLNAGGTLDLEGLTSGLVEFVDLNGAGNIVLGETLLELSNAGNRSLSGVISGFDGAIKKTGAGVLTLSGVNTFTGGVEVAQGTLRLANNAAAGTGTIRTTGSVIDYADGVTIGNHVVLDSNATQLQVLTGDATHSGVIGESGGPRPLEKIGDGNLVLTGANTYTGLTTVTAGRLQLGDGGVVAGDINVGPNANSWFDFVQTGTLTYAGVLSGGQFSQSGSGTTIWEGANTHSYTGISQGTLLIGSGGTLGATNATFGISGIGAGGTLDLGGTAQTVSGFRLFNGFTNSIVNGDLTVTGIMTAEAGTIGANLGGAGTLVKDTAGTLTLSGTNTYAGQTTINAGTLILQDGSAIADTNAVTVASGATLQLNDEELIGSLAGAGTLAIGNKRLDTGFDNTDTVWTGTVTGSLTSGLRKFGTGNFTITGDLNQETTSINAGEIAFNGTATGSIFVNSGGRLSGNHTINGDLSVDVGGTLAPGNSPGTTTVLGNYTGGGTLEVEVQFDNAGAPDNGVTHDFLNISGGVTGGPTTVSLLTFPPSGEPAATEGNGIEIVRVGGSSTAGDFTMPSYLLGAYYYNLVYLSNYIGGTVDSFFLQSSLATPGCSVDNNDNACFVDATTNQTTPVDALAGNDTLQLTGATDFDFDVGGIGSIYTNFEVFQKAGTSTVTLTGATNDSFLGIDVQNGKLIAGTNQLGRFGLLNISTSGTVQLASDLTVGGLAGSGTLDLQANSFSSGGSNANTTFSGVIEGSGGLTMSGVGTQTLSGTNTFSGPTIISSGTLAVTGGSALADTNPVSVVGSGATLSVLQSETIGGLFGRGFTNIAANQILTTGGSDTDSEYMGLISGSGGLTKIGTGNFTLSGINSYSGATVISAGALTAAREFALGTNSALTINANANLTLNRSVSVGSLAGSGGVNLNFNSLATGSNNSDSVFSGVIQGFGNLSKNGTGSFTLSGTNTFTGSTAINDGTLLLQGGSAIASSRSVFVGSGATLKLADSQTIGALFGSGSVDIADNELTIKSASIFGSQADFEGVISGSGNVVLDDSSQCFTGSNTFTGKVFVKSGSLCIGRNSSAGSIIGDIELEQNTVVFFSRSNDYEYASTVSGAGSLTKNGAGTLILSGRNDHSGYTAVLDGILRVQGIGTLGGQGVVLNVVDSTLDLGGTNQAVDTVYMLYDSGKIENGTLAANVLFANGGEISANLTGNGHLSKGDPSKTLILSGSNSYLGGTTFAGGTIVAQGGNAIPDSASFRMGDFGNATILRLLDDETIGSIYGDTQSAIEIGTYTITIANDGFFGGVISGIGGLTKTQTGNLTLAGNNTFTGAANIQAGSLSLEGDGNVVGDIQLGSNATLVVNKSSDITLNQSISGGRLDKRGVGTVTLTNAQLFRNADLYGGRLTISGPGAFIAPGGAINLRSGAQATLDLGSTSQTISQLMLLFGSNSVVNGNLTVTSFVAAEQGIISANLQGAGILFKSSVGTLTLSGTNIYTGPTVINGGTLALTGGAAVSDSNAVTINGGTLSVLQSETIGSLAGATPGSVNVATNHTLTSGANDASTSFTGTFSGAGGLTKTGIGTFTVGDIGLTGLTTVEDGELKINGTTQGSVSIAANGRLSGNTDINGNLTNLGTLASGNSPGTTNVFGNYTGGGILEVEVQFDNAGAPDNGVTHDFLNITGDVLGSPTTVTLTSFPPSFEPAATTGNGIEIVRVGGAVDVDDFAMTEYLFGDFFYNLVFIDDIYGPDSFFLQSTSALPGCVVSTGNDACFVDAATDQLALIDALAGNDTLQLTGDTNFDFDVGGLGATYANFEVFQKAGASTVTLTGTTTLTNLGVDVQDGTLIAGTSQLGASGVLNIFTPGVLQLASSLTVGSLAGSGTLDLQSFVFSSGGLNADTNFSGVVQGAGEFAKTGAGNLTLSGVNTMTGAVEVNGGTLTLDGTAALAQAAAVTVNGATLALASDQTLNRLLGSGAVALNANRLTLTGSSFSFFNGVISGASGGVTLQNNATLSLTQAQTYTGQTRINNASMTLFSAGNLAGDVDLQTANARLVFANSSDVTYGGVMSGLGAVTLNAGGTVTWTGANTFTGGLNLLAGTLALSGGGTLGGPTNTIDFFGDEGPSFATLDLGGTSQTITALDMDGGLIENGALTVTGPTNLERGEISAVLAGATAVAKNGPGTFTLSGNNSYTGGTSIFDGTLIAANVNAFGDEGDLTIGALGTLRLDADLTIGDLDGGGAINLQTNRLTLGGDNSDSLYLGNISGAGGLIKDGAGLLTLSGDNTFSGGIEVLSGGLKFNANIATGSGAFTMSGGYLDYGAGGTVNNQIILNAATTEILVASGTAFQTGAITQTGGARALRKTGAGNLFLTGAGAYTGATLIDAGTLTASNPSALGVGSAVTVANAATLALNDSISIGSLGGAGNVDLAANVLMLGGDNASTAASGVISGAGGKLIKTGSGMLTLSGANTFTGGIDLMQGGISLGGNSAAGTGTIRTFGSVVDYANGVNSAAPIDINSNTTQVLVLVGSAIQSGVISETGGPRPLEKIGAGNLTLSGVNTYTGTTTITAGTLTLQGGSAIADASNLTIGASGQLTLLNSETIGGLNGSGNVNLNGNTLTSGAFNDTFHLFSGVISGTGGFVKAGSDPQYLSGDNTYTGLTQVQSGSLLLGFGGTTGSIAGNAQINGGAALFFNRSNAYAYAGNISGAGAISHAGTGTTTLSGINTYTGDTVIGNGVLAASGGTAIGDTSAVNVSTSGRFDLLSSETIGSLAGNGNTVLNGNTLTTGGNNASTTYSGVMSGAGGLTKLGTGTFTLSGANAYTGATAINAGTLTVANASALGVNSAVTVANAATLALNSNLTIGSLAGTGDTTLGVNTLTTGGNNASTTYAGVMSGAGGLTKTGVGTFFLTGENTYAGGTQVNSGSLILSNGGDVQGNVNVSGAGVFGFQKSSAYTFGGTVSGTNMAKFGSGTVTLAAANTNTFTAVHEGTLTVSGSGTFGGPNVTISMPGPFAPATLDLGGTTQSIRALAMDFDPANAVTNGTLIATDQFVIGRGAYSANLGGAASMFKSGTGTATLSGNNTFTGGTTINNGTLVLQGGAAIADLSAVVVNPSGTLQLANNETVGNLSGFGSVNLGANVLTLGGNNANASMGGTITGAGGKLIKNGSGILALSGNNTFTGGIDIFGGGISLQTNTAAGTGPITTFGSIIDYANGIDVATPIVLSSNDTQLQQIGGAATQSGPISEIGGSRPLEKIGGGNVTLSGANTFTGPMTITDGTLTVTGGSALSDTSPTILAASGTLAVTGSETIGALSGSGALNLGSGATLTTGVNNTSTIFTGASSGAGNLTKDGTGTFLLTGANSFSGLLNVAGGALTVTPSGSLANMSVNVANGASARLGAGTLGVNGGGMTGAGMGALSVASGGTLYLDDNTTVGASSLTLSTGSNLGVFLTTDTSIYPQIALTGAANVGGNLDVYLDPLSFGSTTATTFTYDNVILGATRTGTFGAVNLLQTPNNLFSAAALYGANDVDLQVTRSSFASLGGPGGNAGSVGGAIETIFVGGTTQPDLLNLINTVASASPAQILIIYSNISGSINAEVEAAGLRTDDPWKQTVAERVNAARAPGCTVAGDTWCLRRYAQAAAPVMSDVQGDPSAFDWLQTGIREDGTTSAWLRAVGAWAEADSSLNAPGSTQWTGGVIGGIDRVFDSLLLAGVAGQYLETNVDFDKSTNKSNVKAVQLGGYVSYGGAEAYLNANASVIGSTAKSERRMSVGLIDYDIDSFLRTWTYTFAAEAGTIIEDDGFRFEPSVALNFSHGQTGEYAESNGGGLALLVRPEDTQSLRSTLTARLSKVIDVGDRKIVPQLKIDWRHEMLDRGQGFDAAFAGAPDVWFKVDGTQYGRDTFTMGAAVTVPITGRITGYVDAQGSLNEDVVSGMASMGVRATW